MGYHRKTLSLFCYGRSAVNTVLSRRINFFFPMISCRRTWLRAIGNLKVKLHNAAPSYRDAIIKEHFLDGMRGPGPSGLLDPLLQRADRPPTTFFGLKSGSGRQSVYRYSDGCASDNCNELCGCSSLLFIVVSLFFCFFFAVHSVNGGTVAFSETECVIQENFNFSVI